MTLGTFPPAVLCIGNICVDESVHLDGTRTLAPGGDAVYAALGALLSSARVSMLAPLGNDLPEDVLQELDQVGLDPTALPRRQLPTLRHVITHRPDGGRDWSSNASDDEFDALSVQPSDLTEALLAVEAVVVTAMGLQAQCTIGPWLRDHTRATRYLDLREDYLDARAQLLDLVATADVFMPSEIEATVLAGTTDLEAAAATFAQLGPHTVVIKCGAHGCLVHTGHNLVAVPAAAATVVDTTGAGDAFCGAFAAEHVRSGDAVAAARAATRVAAVAVSGLGTAGLLDELSRRRVPA